MELIPGQMVIYSWNPHMLRWNKNTKTYGREGNVQKAVKFLRMAGERAVILCQTPCGPKEMRVMPASLSKVSA